MLNINPNHLCRNLLFKKVIVKEETFEDPKFKLAKISVDKARDTFENVSRENRVDFVFEIIQEQLPKLCVFSDPKPECKLKISCIKSNLSAEAKQSHVLRVFYDKHKHMGSIKIPLWSCTPEMVARSAYDFIL